MLCRRCGIREVPERQGPQASKPGRPRTCCLTCVPYRRQEGGREAVRASNERKRARERTDVNWRMACGCGRDYMQVPLEDAHLCPMPVAVPDEPEPARDSGYERTELHVRAEPREGESHYERIERWLAGTAA